MVRTPLQLSSEIWNVLHTRSSPQPESNLPRIGIQIPALGNELPLLQDVTLPIVHHIKEHVVFMSVVRRTSKHSILKRWIARASGLPLVLHDFLDEAVAVLENTLPSRSDTEICNVDNPIETFVPTGVSYDITTLLHTQSNLNRQSSASTLSRSPLQLRAKRFSLP